MQPATTEWVAKAEGDYTTALRECRARTCPNYDAACFHAQQCAEKYLKALLQEDSMAFEKTHDLVKLCHRRLNWQHYAVIWQCYQPQPSNTVTPVNAQRMKPQKRQSQHAGLYGMKPASGYTFRRD